MPWNNQGNGGPWGSPPGGGGHNPWGGGSGGGGGSPDLEELLRKGQDRVRKMTPKGFGGFGLGLVALVAVGLWGLSGLYRVEANQAGVVLRFGEYVETTGPGLHYHLPYPIETVLKPDVTSINEIQVGFQTDNAGRERDVPAESLMLTQDENIIDVDFVVRWRIADRADLVQAADGEVEVRDGPRNYLFNLKDVDETIKRAAESAMREVIGRTPIAEALVEDRTRIQQEAQTILQTLLNDYRAGVYIDTLQLQKTDAPRPVIDAFNDVQRARQELDQVRNVAEAYRNDVVPRARGRSEQMKQQAQAYREQVVNKAQGDAERFLSVYLAYANAKDVTARRLYLETMEQIMAKSNKILIDQAANQQGVLPYLPLDQLNRRAPAPAPASQTAPAAPATPAATSAQ